MTFEELAGIRQSCRKYDSTKTVEDEKIQHILEVSNLAPSACNGQPYKVTVVRGEKAKQVAIATSGPGLNKFAATAPVMIVISEDNYVKTAAIGAKIKGNDYRSIDIGILSSFITLAAAESGLGTCILGWFDDKRIRSLCGIDSPVRLVITLGYPAQDCQLRQKKRKNTDSYISYIE